ncbi:MAG: 4-alpha-glucanotransferase, partial [Ilumatobacter fluminis]
MTETAPFPSRCYGVLMHPTSFPGPEPIGTLGAEAHEFVDWLATTGASIWQILPLTYLGSEDSPYFSPSSFAGNTWLIDLRELVAAGLIAGIGTPPRGDEIQVDFEAMRTWKAPLLDAAAGAFLDDDGHPWWPDYERFVADSPWLADVCHFIARKHADPVSP